jgi:hypothetical protein
MTTHLKNAKALVAHRGSLCLRGVCNSKMRDEDPLCALGLITTDKPTKALG